MTTLQVAPALFRRQYCVCFFCFSFFVFLFFFFLEDKLEHFNFKRLFTFAVFRAVAT